MVMFRHRTVGVLELDFQRHRLRSKSSIAALLSVIDMQDEFVKSGWTPYWVPEATRQVPRIKTLIAHCQGKDTVIICGTTARQAYERSFKVIFGSDVNATDDPDLQEPELKVLTADEILRALI